MPLIPVDDPEDLMEPVNRASRLIHERQTYTLNTSSGASIVLTLVDVEEAEHLALVSSTEWERPLLSAPFVVLRDTSGSSLWLLASRVPSIFLGEWW
jgi:hypothetical protein